MASVRASALISAQGNVECAVSFQEEPAARLQPPEKVKNPARPWNLALESPAQGNQTSQDWPLSTYVVALNVTQGKLTIELCVMWD